MKGTIKEFQELQQDHIIGLFLYAGKINLEDVHPLLAMQYEEFMEYAKTFLK